MAVVSPCLAVLLAGPHPGEAAMHSDLIAMYEALRRRGLRPEQILALEGPLDRPMVLHFVGDIATRIASWPAGDVLVYYTGHGAYWPWQPAEASEARPALFVDGAEDEPQRWVFWDELLAELRPPPGVRLGLLPDC